MSALARWLVYGHVGLATTSPLEVLWLLWTCAPFFLALWALRRADGDRRFNREWIARLRARGVRLTPAAEASRVRATVNFRAALVVAFFAAGFAYFGVQAALIAPRPAGQGGGVTGIVSPLLFIAMSTALNALIVLEHRARGEEQELMRPAADPPAPGPTTEGC